MGTEAPDLGPEHPFYPGRSQGLAWEPPPLLLEAGGGNGALLGMTGLSGPLSLQMGKFSCPSEPQRTH